MSVLVDHNYPHDGDMTVLNISAEPISGVTIRIFDHTAFFAGDLDTWEAETVTDMDGNWLDPVYLDEARTWVVHFQKLNEYGPDHLEITT